MTTLAIFKVCLIPGRRFVFEPGSHSPGWLATQRRSTCLCLLRAVIKGMGYHSRPGSYFNGQVNYFQEPLGLKKFTSLELQRCFLLKKNLTC